MEAIQQANAKSPSTWQAKFVQFSPQSVRRASSPQPMQAQGGKSGGGGSGTGGILGKLKRTLTRQREADNLDYSSFTTFGQPLQNCPVSPDNKVSSWLLLVLPC